MKIKYSRVLKKWRIEVGTYETGIRYHYYRSWLQAVVTYLRGLTRA